MNLFEKIFGAKPKSGRMMRETKGITAYSPHFTAWNGELYENELIRAAIHARANYFSRMSIDIVGAAQPKLRTAFKHSPNPWQTTSQFLYRVSTILDVHNTCFLVPLRNQYGETVGVYPVLPRSCKIKEYNGEFFVAFEFPGGESAAVEFDKVGILTQHQYRNDYFGDPNTALNATMELINLQNQGIAEGVKNGATYRFMAHMMNFMDDDDLVEERKKFSKANLSAANDNSGLLLFPNTYENPTQIKNETFVADPKQMELIKANVYDYYGVNDHILQNCPSEDELDGFHIGFCEPRAIQLAEVLTKMLFTALEQSYGAGVKVTTDRLQFMSFRNRILLATNLGDRGFLMRDEGRGLFGLAALPNGSGAVIPVRGEYYDAITGKKIGETEPVPSELVTIVADGNEEEKEGSET